MAIRCGISGLAFVALALSLAAALHAQPGETADRLSIPDVDVQDQDGRTLRFHGDLLHGKIVAVNFLFTECSTICPQLGANSAALARLLAENTDDRLRVISVSIDAATDSPDRLREWSAHFGAAPGWKLITGKRRDIDTLLRAFQVYTPDNTLHTGNFLLGNIATGEWRRIAGSTAPAQLAATLRELAGPVAPPAPPPSTSASATAATTTSASATESPTDAASRYFPDVSLVNQHGESRRFFTDLVKGRVVVINTIFSDCSAVCPIMTERFAKVQTQLGDRLGRDVFLLSISVDPVTDTPAKLAMYAKHVGAKPGWEFLTGDKASVDLVLKKLGQYVESRDAHSNLVIVGNEPTGLWKKAFGLAPADDVVRVVESVMNDGR